MPMLSTFPTELFDQSSAQKQESEAEREFRFLLRDRVIVIDRDTLEKM